jgi:tRNA modification GTPase
MISTNQDTIAAIATSHGVGSIAIIRISGDKSLLIAHALTNNKILKPRVATLSKIYSDKEIIDQSILIYFKAPYSFTGEDIVEIQAHGGVVIANAILKEVINQGARLATAGEFSKRAFLNNKIDLTQAGAIAAMAIPSKPKQTPIDFTLHTKNLLDEYDNYPVATDKPLAVLVGGYQFVKNNCAQNRHQF